MMVGLVFTVVSVSFTSSCSEHGKVGKNSFYFIFNMKKQLLDDWNFNL
jgi:hypothetical protein